MLSRTCHGFLHPKGQIQTTAYAKGLQTRKGFHNLKLKKYIYFMRHKIIWQPDLSVYE